MAEKEDVKIRNRLFISGDVNDQEFQREIKMKADRCCVSGLVRNARDDQLELILEGEKKSVSRVVVWLMRGPRLTRIRRLESDTEEFIDEFKGGKFRRDL